MEITHKIKMDLNRPGITPRIPAVQGDAYTRKLSISLFADRRPWRIPSGASVVIRYLKPDRTSGAYDTLADGTSAVHVSGNTVNILVAPEALSLAGTVSLMVTILLGEQRLSTFSMALEVAPDCVSGWTDEDGAAWIAAFLPSPEAAKPGQHFAADTVDEAGHVLSVKTVDPAQWLANSLTENGITESISISHQWDGTILTVTSASGTSSTDLKGDTGAQGKSAYEYAQDGGYTGTEADFAAKLAQEIPAALPNPNALTINGQTYDGSAAVNVDTGPFIVTVTGTSEDGYSADKTYVETLAAHDAGQTVVCCYDGLYMSMLGMLEGALIFTASASPDITATCAYWDGGININTSMLTITINNKTWNCDTAIDFTSTINGMISAKTDELTAADVGALPDTTATLPNPNALTINGKVYDGSEAVNITIASDSARDNNLLGPTPITLTDAATVKLVGAGEHTYTVKGKTIADLSTATISKSNAEITEHGDYIEISDTGASEWYSSYVTLSVSGLTVGTTYVLAIVGLGLDSTNLINNGYYLIRNSSGTELGRIQQDAAAIHSVEFTPDTSDITIACYPATNYYWGQGYRTVRIEDLYINEAADGTERTDIINKSGTFTDSYSLGLVSKGVTVTTEPSCEVYSVSADSSGTATLPLAGKTIVCFGDSLFGMYTGDTSAPAYVAERTGATVYNVGFGGCRMSVHPYTGYNEFCMYALATAVASGDWSAQDAAVSSGSSNSPEQLAILKGIDFTKVDAIVIHYGTNDFTAGAGVALDNADDPKDCNTLCGALRYSIETLLTAYPQLRIFVSVPAFRYWTADDGTVTFPHSYTNVNGSTLTEFIDAIGDTAKEYNLPVIDSYYGLGINKINAAAFLGDGVHHNEAGRKRFGNFIGSCMIASF